MLQMHMYSERTVNKNGIITRTGEDAFPYINEAGMFVADGMGGGAGVPIIGFHSDCFEESTLADRLLEIFDGLNDQGRKDLAEYIKNNFASLTDPVMTQLYQTPGANSLRLKKSGYVGSHALGVVLAAYLISLKEQFPDAEKWEETIRQIKDSLFDKYKETIRQLGAECAKVSLNKIDYFGTTLTAAFFYETEDSVDVIFLNCGDSRSYVLDEKGFRQASDDQGRNGGMTSRFSLGKDVSVEISLERKSYKKPCAFLCMTDGIYSAFSGKNGFHSTPLYMEGFLMNTLSAANSLEEAQQRLKAIFDAKGQIDDSNTIAAAFFGYESYPEIKAAAASRMDYLNTTYSLPSLPDDFLLEDYQKTLQALQAQSADQLMPLLQEAFQLTTVKNHCLDRIKQPGHSAKYGVKQREIRAEMDEISQKKKDIRNRLCKIAEGNFIDFVDVDSVEQSTFAKIASCMSTSPQEKAREIGDAFHQTFTRRDAAISEVLKNIQELYENVCESAEHMRIEPTQAWKQGWEKDSIDWANKTSAMIRNTASKSLSQLQKMSELSRYLTEQGKQWNTMNQKAMVKYSEQRGTVKSDNIVDSWLSEPQLEQSLCITTMPSVRKAILKLAGKYHAYTEQTEQLQQDYQNAQYQAAEQYWTDQAIYDISILLSKEDSFAENPELAQKIREKLNQNEELSRCQQLADQQQDVFQRYMSEHLADVSDDKRADVEKCGWM